MRRGEIWWGAPRLAGGSSKRRPFVIVSANVFNANPRYPKVVVVQLTSSVRSRAFDWEVHLPRGVGGLPAASVVKCAEVYTLLKDQLVEVVGTLPRAWLGRVDRALGISLALTP